MNRRSTICPSQLISDKKWGGCAFSLTLEDDNSVTDDNGLVFHNNFACGKPEVVAKGNHQVRTIPKGQGWLHLAILHGAGKYDDPQVLTVLQQVCGNCPFYIARVAIRK